MELTGWTVDRFGHLADRTVAQVGPRLTVLLGPNESGKTTTHHFLRWVLLGFPAANNGAFRRYRADWPSIGGRLRVRHHGRDLVLERHSGGGGRATLSEPSGAPVTDVTMRDLVGATTPELYRSVFAVGLDELREVEALSMDDVREHVLAAGLVGSGRSATEALRELDRARDQILGRRRGGHVRDLARDLDDARAALAAARSRGAALGSLRDRAERLESEAAAARADLDSAREEVDLYGGLVELWPTWVRRSTAARELSDLPDVELGPDPLGRVQDLLDRVDRADEEAERLVDELAEVDRQLAACDPDPVLVEARDHARQAEADHRAALSRRAELAVAADRLALDQAALRADLSELGPGWDACRVEGSPVRQASLAELESLAADLTAARTAAVGAARDAGAAADSLVAAEHRLAEAAREETAAGATASGRGRSRSGSPPPVGAHAVALAGSVAAVVLLAGAAIAAGAPVAGVSLAAVGLLALCGSVALVLADRTSRRSEVRAPHPEPGRLDAAVADARSAAHLAGAASRRARSHLSSLLVAWEDAAHALDLPTDGGPVATTSLARSVLEIRSRLRDVARARDDLEAASTELAAGDEQRSLLVAELGGDAGRTPDELARALADLAQRCDRAAADQVRARELAARREDLTGRLARTDSDRRRAGDALQARLAAAGVADVPGLRSLVGRVERRRSLAEVVSAAEVALAERFGAGELAVRARKELAVGRTEDWARAQAAASDRVDRLGQEHRDLLDRAAEARHEVRVVEASSDIPAAEMEVDRLTNDLADAAGDWVRLTLARDSIAATLERFERERQPAVVARAASSLQRISGGRWDRVVSKDRGLEVLSPAGVRLVDSCLSRGTVEQLYLALRLSLARSHADRTARLPVLLDDVTVNADDERTASLAAELADAADDLQIVVFTARRATAEALVAARADTRVIDLSPPDGATTGGR